VQIVNRFYPIAVHDVLNVTPEDYILSDSQAAIKALGKHPITLKLVWDCHQSLIQLASHNKFS
jgi:hypothetical protein